MNPSRERDAQHDLAHAAEDRSADDDASKHQSLPIFTCFNVTSAQHPTRVQDVEGGQNDDEYLLAGQNLRTTMMIGVPSAPDRRYYRLP